MIGMELLVRRTERIPIHRVCSVLSPLQHQQELGTRSISVRIAASRSAVRPHESVWGLVVVEVISVGEIAGQLQRLDRTETLPTFEEDR